MGFDTGDTARQDGAGSGSDAASSCKGMMATCGPAANAPCCESLPVTGGSFSRGYDVGTDALFPDASNVAVVSDFRLDKYEVTVGRFRQFTLDGHGTKLAPPAASAGAHAKIAGSGWIADWTTSLLADPAALAAAVKCDPALGTWTDAPADNENLPMNCISWYEAFAFCVWDGGFLPTEAEWNYAATGGAEQRAYPWSAPAFDTAIDTTRASYQCMGDGVAGCTIADVFPVGTKAGDGLWGHADLAGNLAEWVLDWQAAYPNPCTDCANLTPATYRVARGGSFNALDTQVRTASDTSLEPVNRTVGFGVRCARAP